MFFPLPAVAIGVQHKQIREIFSRAIGQSIGELYFSLLLAGGEPLTNNANIESMTNPEPPFLLLRSARIALCDKLQLRPDLPKQRHHSLFNQLRHPSRSVCL